MNIYLDGIGSLLIGDCSPCSDMLCLKIRCVDRRRVWRWWVRVFRGARGGGFHGGACGAAAGVAR